MDGADKPDGLIEVANWALQEQAPSGRAGHDPHCSWKAILTFSTFSLQDNGVIHQYVGDAPVREIDTKGIAFEDEVVRRIPGNPAGF
jgi:hypothetical protein